MRAIIVYTCAFLSFHALANAQTATAGGQQLTRTVGQTAQQQTANINGKTQSPLTVKLNEQQRFPKDIPAGNYSGIAWLGGTYYAVVSDKSEKDGFFVFDIKTDSLSGVILSAHSLGFRGTDHQGRDNEGIAYIPRTHTIAISGESDNSIKGMTIEGKYTGWQWTWPGSIRKLPGNEGLEALTYDTTNGRLWTCNETMPVTLVSIDSTGNILKEIPYNMDTPLCDRQQAQYYAHGVPTLCALDSNRLLVLEREAFVPKIKIGARVYCKLFEMDLTKQQKTLLAEWKTSLGLLNRSFANYEGMCLGPRLTDGSRLLLFVADSQGQYAGVLSDWLKTAILIESKPTGESEGNEQ